MMPSEGAKGIHRAGVLTRSLCRGLPAFSYAEKDVPLGSCVGLLKRLRCSLPHLSGAGLDSFPLSLYLEAQPRFLFPRPEAVK